MRFELAKLYRPGALAAWAADGPLGDGAGAAGVVCPHCQVLYLADLDEEMEELEAGDRGLRAARRPNAECPDHPVRFEVG